MLIRRALPKHMLIWCPFRLARTTSRKHYPLVAPRRRTKLSGIYPTTPLEEGTALTCKTLA